MHTHTHTHPHTPASQTLHTITHSAHTGQYHKNSAKKEKHVSSGGLYKAEKRVTFQMQHLQVLFEAAGFSEHFDTSFKKNWLKNDVAPAKNLFRGEG